MKGDLKRLQGTWRIVSLEMDGQTMGGGGAEITVDGTRFTTNAMGAEYSGTLVLEVGHSPRRFDLQFEEGPENGNTSLGIYELDGDSWKICLTLRGGTRPTVFAAAAGTGLALEVLQRAGAASTVSASSSGGVTLGAVPPGETAPELAGEWVSTLLVRDGEALTADVLQFGKRTASANEVIVKFGPQVMVKARYSVDRSASPMSMDYALANGGWQRGIWKFQGGELTTCFGASGADRPVDFASVRGDGRTLAVWVRKRK